MFNASCTDVQACGFDTQQADGPQYQPTHEPGNRTPEGSATGCYFRIKADRSLCSSSNAAGDVNGDTSRLCLRVSPFVV